MWLQRSPRQRPTRRLSWTGQSRAAFERQYLTDSFTFNIVFRLSLPSHSALHMSRLKMRKQCTKDNPSDLTPYEWCHPDAVCIDSYDGWEEGTSYDKKQCPHCGVIFKEYATK